MIFFKKKLLLQENLNQMRMQVKNLSFLIVKTYLVKIKQS